MKAEELRIGNYVWDDYSGKLIVVTIKKFTLELCKRLDLPSGRYNIDKIDPIPLTEEWLLKYGFEPILNGAGYIKNNTEIGFNHNGFYIITSGFKIESVHQLQNLYFGLTGEELEIK
jgi:hypothetical protein